MLPYHTNYLTTEYAIRGQGLRCKSSRFPSGLMLSADLDGKKLAPQSRQRSTRSQPGSIGLLESPGWK